MKKSSITNRRAQEFVNIVKNGTHEDLLNLYYKYKGFYKTGTADFVQQIVVDFMEEYCIAIKQKIQEQKSNKSIDLTQPTIEPSNSIKNNLLKKCLNDHCIITNSVMIGTLISKIQTTDLM